jgi:hypothetical protein
MPFHALLLNLDYASVSSLGFNGFIIQSMVLVHHIIESFCKLSLLAMLSHIALGFSGVKQLALIDLSGLVQHLLLV